MSLKTEMDLFNKKYSAAAKAAAAGTGIFYQTILSAAALESGFGKSKLAANHNNFFGIKADSSWKGKFVEFRTKEQTKQGEVYTVLAKFRHYDTAEESFKNYVKFISGPRYVKAGVTKAKTVPEQFEKLQAAGYATDVSYSDKLKKMFNAVTSWITENPTASASAGIIGFFLYCF